MRFKCLKTHRISLKKKYKMSESYKEFKLVPAIVNIFYDTFQAQKVAHEWRNPDIFINFCTFH